MSDLNFDHDFFETVFAEADPSSSAELRAPARLKSRSYSQLVQRQAESGPLLSISETKASGHGLCVFEEAARLAPFGKKFKRRNYCRACHARKLAEMMESAPIYWAHCPYTEFQK